MSIRRALLASAILALLGGSAVGASTPVATPAIARSPYIAGDAFDRIPETADGTLSVATFAITDGSAGDLAVVVRNTTDAEAVAVRVVATARTSDGRVYAVSDALDISPTRIVAGGVGIGTGTVQIRGTTLAGGLTFEFDVGEAATSSRFEEQHPDMAITSVRRVDDRIVGEAVNESGRDLSRLLRVQGLCFLNAAPVWPFWDVIRDDTVVPGETVPFQEEIPNLCEAFLVTVR